MRVSEFLRVNMKKDTFIDDRYFIVRESKTEAGRNRSIPIHKDLIPFFRIRQKFEWLATTKKGERFTTYSQFRRMYTELMNDLNMKHSIHETRHTCATLLDAADVNDMVTRKILGHAGQGITKAVYIHKYVQDLIDGIDKVKGKDI
jgi:integrase